MARVTYNQPFTNFDVSKAANVGVTGTVTDATSTHIGFSDGSYSADLKGIFVYGSTQLMGRVSEISYSKDGSTYMTVSELGYNLSGSVPTSFYEGDDTYIGSSGNDLFGAWFGNDKYDGGAGTDTVYYSASKNDFVVKASGNGLSLDGLGKTDSLVNIERVQFDDGTLAVDINAGQNAGSGYRLYQAAFDRKPDNDGLKYWINDLDKGSSLQQVAKGFVDSAEFKALNPGQDQNSLINNFYQHVLHRDADAGGLQYWNGQMSGGMTAAEVLVSFSESQENIANVAPDLNNGLWLV
ncbi:MULTISPECIES: DUF4214 domain-containing protein [Pseudomonas syringae group]|uniref:DUF4214 domain-containing protein n=3 Tax=Pseudomonas syringae group TaxID=136849 RepID=A0ABX6HL29_9PSED|nr:DUF4214 domain-containing protein [Pseudomonas asturiensis]QHF05969.1 DUF4214 domain-containing protein [Pseudomonas asturiensis]